MQGQTAQLSRVLRLHQPPPLTGELRRSARALLRATGASRQSHPVRADPPQRQAVAESLRCGRSQQQREAVFLRLHMVTSYVPRGPLEQSLCNIAQTRDRQRPPLRIKSVAPALCGMSHPAKSTEGMFFVFAKEFVAAWPLQLSSSLPL